MGERDIRVQLRGSSRMGLAFIQATLAFLSLPDLIRQSIVQSRQHGHRS
jgi:hypothetical protein